ncbi:hypothetical protein EV421DRAFT_1742356 [Armillaria borealis]|uniref:Uncharacterized protein n=1 Tax=Armillaria borealis TaxID=47425 RepID=A0AA39IZE8_9AGAR|nr:hypothetical protein EV421DRAFT_1742356 [Armillaria borealis]
MVLSSYCKTEAVKTMLETPSIIRLLVNSATTRVNFVGTTPPKVFTILSRLVPDLWIRCTFADKTQEKKRSSSSRRYLQRYTYCQSGKNQGAAQAMARFVEFFEESMGQQIIVPASVRSGQAHELCFFTRLLTPALAANPEDVVEFPSSYDPSNALEHLLGENKFVYTDNNSITFQRLNTATTEQWHPSLKVIDSQRYSSSQSIPTRGPAKQKKYFLNLETKKQKQPSAVDMVTTSFEGQVLGDDSSEMEEDK